MTASSAPHILIPGCNGQVGWELQRTLSRLGEVTAVQREQMDLASADSIRACVRAAQPTLIVNAAAYTAVDKAESEPELAQAINATAVGVLAEEAKRLGAAMIHYSTDYVFDGSKPTPYVESDATNPLSVYGKTKLAGEQVLASAGIPYLTLRTSWVYGARGRNFLLTILKLAAEKPELRIVADQIGAPTSAREIAMATAAIVQHWLAGDAAQRSGIYHLTAAGSTTWYGFAEEALRLRKELRPREAQQWAKLTAISTAEYPTPAARPKNSQLNCEKLAQAFSICMQDWKIALAAVMQEKEANAMATQNAS